MIYSTNAIESLNARFRRATKARGHFPNEQAAMKCLYLVIRSLDPKSTRQERWMNRWKPRLRHHLRRPPLLAPSKMMSNAPRQTSYTNDLTDPI